MQKDMSSPIKNALIEYVKSHNDTEGKIMEFINHLDEAEKVAKSLPIDIQNDLIQIIVKGLIASGIVPVSVRR